MFENGKRPHITVVGDLILDRYLIGDATKLNPEQTGVVIRVDKEEDRLGGAAAVAMIAAGFGARVTLAGVVGRDEPGCRLQQLIADHGIEPHLWIDDRTTTWKQRIVARGQLRPDRCDREVTTPIGDYATRFLAEVSLGDILLVSDYGKGVCTQSMLHSIGQRARERNIPTLIDPARGRPWYDYHRVRPIVIKSNWLEASESVVCGESDDPLAVARYLAARNGCSVVITLGAGGMICGELSGETWSLPAVATRVVDVCGAGDTVFAMLGLRLARGDDLFHACRAAMIAASRQVATHRHNQSVSRTSTQQNFASLASQ